MLLYAPVVQRIERSVADAEVGGSNPSGRAKSLSLSLSLEFEFGPLAQSARASHSHCGGRGFDSPTVHHMT